MRRKEENKDALLLTETSNGHRPHVIYILLNMMYRIGRSHTFVHVTRNMSGFFSSPSVYGYSLRFSPFIFC